MDYLKYSIYIFIYLLSKKLLRKCFIIFDIMESIIHYSHSSFKKWKSCYVTFIYHIFEFGMLIFDTHARFYVVERHLRKENGFLEVSIMPGKGFDEMRLLPAYTRKAFSRIILHWKNITLDFAIFCRIYFVKLFY